LKSLTPAELAALHRICLPSSFPARLGESYLCDMYKYLLRSPREVIVSFFDNNTLSGAAITTFEPKTLARRLLFRTGVVWHAPSLLKRSRMFPIPLRSSATGPFFKPIADTPELIWIFVGPNHRNRSIGSSLIAETEVRLRERWIDRYYVRTFPASDDPARRFYQRLGFSVAGKLRSRGEEFQCLVKHI
jgi:GNAT superfamily N-acetyltransferase